MPAPYLDVKSPSGVSRTAGPPGLGRAADGTRRPGVPRLSARTSSEWALVLGPGGPVETAWLLGLAAALPAREH
ncbi:hypothetical protein [Actinomadura geliboluensis]|uniref:Uncharacterized protein n=1 Tax=Actinomadura geliboluensis TaxID=882440 RepID=A0A5S4GNN0_9ACTN|nr:hypothetical protein [Actinomadura geliboluensis]TMR34503.1 hypothetical protein ETD96_25080 [Actinomadura geliboluensis]